MSATLQAAADLQAFAERLRAILEVAEVLQRIGNLEQAARDAQARQTQAYADAAAATVQLTDIQTQLQTAQQQVTSAQQQATQVCTEAQVRADTIRDLAEADAGDLVLLAQDEAQALRLQTSAASAELTQLVEQIQAKRHELQSIVDQIAKTKASIAALTG